MAEERTSSSSSFENVGEDDEVIEVLSSPAKKDQQKPPAEKIQPKLAYYGIFLPKKKPITVPDDTLKAISSSSSHNSSEIDVSSSAPEALTTETLKTETLATCSFSSIIPVNKPPESFNSLPEKFHLFCHSFFEDDAIFNLGEEESLSGCLKSHEIPLTATSDLLELFQFFCLFSGLLSLRSKGLEIPSDIIDLSSLILGPTYLLYNFCRQKEPGISKLVEKESANEMDDKKSSHTISAKFIERLNSIHDDCSHFMYQIWPEDYYADSDVGAEGLDISNLEGKCFEPSVEFFDSFCRMFVTIEDEENEVDGILGECFFAPLLKLLLDLESTGKDAEMASVIITKYNWPSVLVYVLGEECLSADHLSDETCFNQSSSPSKIDKSSTDIEGNSEKTLKAKNSSSKVADDANVSDPAQLARELVFFWKEFEYDQIPSIVRIKTLLFLVRKLLATKLFGSLYGGILSKIMNESSQTQVSKALLKVFRRSQVVGKDRADRRYYDFRPFLPGLYCHDMKLGLWFQFNALSEFEELYQSFCSRKMSNRYLSNLHAEEKKFEPFLKERLSFLRKKCCEIPPEIMQESCSDDKENSSSGGNVSFASMMSEMKTENTLKSSNDNPSSSSILENSCLHSQKPILINRIEIEGEKCKIPSVSLSTLYEHQVESMTASAKEGKSSLMKSVVCKGLIRLESLTRKHFPITCVKEEIPGFSDSNDFVRWILGPERTLEDVRNFMAKRLIWFKERKILFDSGNPSSGSSKYRELPFGLMMETVKYVSSQDPVIPFIDPQSISPVDQFKGVNVGSKFQPNKWFKSLGVCCSRTWNSIYDWLLYYEKFILNPLIMTSGKRKFPGDRMTVSCLTDDICQICESSKSEGKRGFVRAKGSMLLCDLCDSGCHMGCQGLYEIPENNFYCKFCQNSIPMIYDDWMVEADDYKGNKKSVSRRVGKNDIASIKPKISRKTISRSRGSSNTLLRRSGRLSNSIDNEVQGKEKYFESLDESDNESDVESDVESDLENDLESDLENDLESDLENDLENEDKYKAKRQKRIISSSDDDDDN